MNWTPLRTALTGCSVITISIALATGPSAAQPVTTKSTTKTAAVTETKSVEGTVLAVDGNNLVVRMSTGEIRHIVAASSQRAMIDGKEIAAKDLKVGTKLRATVTTTTTSLVDRTVTVGSGRVWYVAAPHVILTLPNGENRQYKATDDYKFMVEGKPATVFELRKGMRVSAEKIVEEPRTVVSSNSVVTGELPAQVATVPATVPAPAPKPAAAPPPETAPAASAPAPTASAPAATTPAASAPAASAPAASTPAAPAAEAPAAAAQPVPATEPAAETTSSSTMLMIGLAVVVLIACIIGFRMAKRKSS